MLLHDAKIRSSLRIAEVITWFRREWLRVTGELEVGDGRRLETLVLGLGGPDRLEVDRLVDQAEVPGLGEAGPVGHGHVVGGLRGQVVLVVG